MTTTELPLIGTCDDCGACCLQQGHPPFRGEEWNRVPPELRAPLYEYLASREENDFGRPCIWLDLQTRRCRHYEHRPQICRDFERGCAMCIHVRLRYKITGK